MVQNYDVGTKAWQPDPTEGWVASELVDRVVDSSQVKLVFQLENGEVRAPVYPLSSTNF
jgi:myosin-5